MSMVEQLETVLQTADAVLEKKNKFDNAIQQGVSELSGLIVARLETERAFRGLEAAASIGEAAGGLEKARKAAADARAALEQASLKLNGLRTALGQQGEALVEAYTTLSGALPAHNARVVEAFEAEWRAALTTWCEVLGRRAAIEGVLGMALDLPEPVPAVVTISADVSRPSETLAALEFSLKSIANLKKIGERQLKPGTYYDPSKIQKIVSDRWATRGVPKGSLVCDASFEPGRLSQIIELGEARQILERDQISGVTIAAAKANEIDKLARDKEAADSERRLHGGPDNSSSRRPDLERERNYQAPKAELDKSASDIAAGIAAGVEARERQRIIDKSLNEAADRDEAKSAEQAKQNKLRDGGSTSADPKQWPDALH